MQLPRLETQEKHRTSGPTYAILVVEDDPEVRLGLQDYFELEGYDVDVAADGEEALEKLNTEASYDIVLLDIMLPKRNGFDVLRMARAVGADFPVLMVTARADEEDVLQGFDLGVDDYIVKPFSVELLHARMRAILNRCQPPGQKPMDIHRFGDVEINFSTHEAFRDGEPIHLTVLEFELLHYLLQSAGRVVTRSKLLEDVWNMPGSLDTRTVDRHIASLRKKIEPYPETPTYILTIYGRGYRFSMNG